MISGPIVEQGFKHTELTEKLIGIFFEVYNELRLWLP